MLIHRIMWLLPSIFLSFIHILPTTTATIPNTLLLSQPQNLTHLSPSSLASTISPSPRLDADRDAQCHLITEPSMPGLNPTNCEFAASRLCFSMHYDITRDRWIWNEQVGCATGYYLSDRSDYPQALCEESFKNIIETCATDSRFNAGTLNVRVLPNFTHDGEARLPMRPMYVMAPERLTL